MSADVLFCSAVAGYVLGIATIALPLFLEGGSEREPNDWIPSHFGDQPAVKDLLHVGIFNTKETQDHV